MVFKRVFFYVPDWSWTAKHLPGHTLHMKTLESTHINHLSNLKPHTKKHQNRGKPKFTILIKQEKIKSKLARMSIHIKKILESDPVPKSAEIRKKFTRKIFRPKSVIFWRNRFFVWISTKNGQFSNKNNLQTSLDRSGQLSNLTSSF